MTQFKKTSIALAVAALASGAAFAQSNVTIYGTVDIGFSKLNKNWDSGVKSQTAIDAGQSADSLIGFKGVEDLGNGNKALFVLEAGFQNDTGAQNGDFLAEQAFLGLTGSWGTAIAGRLVAPRHGFLSALDPFGAGTVGSYRNVMGDVSVGAYQTAAGINNVTLVDSNVPLADVDRVSNAVAYVSPTFSGFNVTAAYATNGLEQELMGKDNNAKVYTILPRYTNGPLDVGVVYQQVKLNEAVLGVDDTDVKLKQWAVGASYDFGAAKVSAFYDTFKIAAGNTANTVYPDLDGLKMKTWLLGVSVPFGKNAVQASYAQSKVTGVDDLFEGKTRQYALGYTYSLSKRTNFYAAYARVKNDKSDGEYTRFNSVGDATNANAGYQQGFQFGLKHDF
ncbi:MAG: porin [Zoogloeaceae bacterium]|jgi:predicted porin|nr:porin [Zoogloeaceae bacterium]